MLLYWFSIHNSELLKYNIDGTLLYLFAIYDSEFIKKQCLWSS